MKQQPLFPTPAPHTPPRPTLVAIPSTWRLGKLPGTVTPTTGQHAGVSMLPTSGLAVALMGLERKS